MKTRRRLRFGAVIIAVVAGLLALTASAGGNISPKADQIAFMSTFDGEADIYTMTLTGLMNKNLTHDETIGMRTDVEPAWSPTGEYVAFQRNFIKADEFGAQLYRVATTGKGLRADHATPEGRRRHPSELVPRREQHRVFQRSRRQLRALHGQRQRVRLDPADPHEARDRQPRAGVVPERRR